MRAALVEAIVRGDRLIWALLALSWVVACVVAVRRPGANGPTHARVFGLLTLTSLTALLGSAVATAVAIPRLRWRAADEAALVSTNGESWRRVRGPAVPVFADGAPDLAIAVADANGDWVLYGILSGKRLEGFGQAPPGVPDAGAARLCSATDEHCRPWPASWPDPARAPLFTDFVWSKELATGALAYDVDSQLYLREVASVDGTAGHALELVGRIANDPPREGASALFVLRRIANGRFEAARLVATGGLDGRFRLDRGRASLVQAPRLLRYLARPALFVCSLALPLGLLAYLLAPMVLATRLRKRSAIRRELSRDLVLVPIGDPTGGLLAASAPGGAAPIVAPLEQSVEPARMRAATEGTSCLAAVVDDADLGDALLARGTLVRATLGAPAGRPVASRVWFELPASAGDAVGVEARAEGLANQHDERGTTRKIGILVPADSAPFRRTARVWLRPMVHAAATFALGLALVMPALVAITAVVTSR